MYNIYNGDCIEVMGGIADKSIDLVVTDPPYLINYKTNHRKDKSHKFCSCIANDNNPELISAYIKELYRIMKDNTAGYMFCSMDKVDFFKQELEKYFNIKNLIVWVKNNCTAGDLKAQFGKQYELIFLFNKGRKFFNGKRLRDVWEFKRVDTRNAFHQNEKPIKLIERCILKHSDVNDVVFDGFMGGGTTGVACINTGRKFIGVEIEKDNFEISKKRIENAKRIIDNSLFRPESYEL